MKEKDRYYLNTNKVKALIEDENMSIREVSETLGVNNYTFYNWITGKNSTNKKTVDEIAALFAVEPDSIIAKNDADRHYCKPKTKNKYIGYMNYEVMTARLEEMGIGFYAMLKTLGLSPQYKNRWEDGGRVNVKHAERIMRYTGLKKDELFSNTFSKDKMTDNNINSEETVNSSDKAVIETIDKAQAPASCYKKFESKNVMENIETLNDNILMLGNVLNNITERISIIESVVEKNNELADSNFQYFNELGTILINMSEKLGGLDKQNKSDNKNVIIKKPVKTVTTVPLNINKLADSYSEDDDLITYKTKINNMISYISKREGLIWNQTCVDFYKTFESVYGENLESLKKEYCKRESKSFNSVPVLEAIYDNPIYRNIFYNMVAEKTISLAELK